MDQKKKDLLQRELNEAHQSKSEGKLRLVSNKLRRACIKGMLTMTEVEAMTVTARRVERILSAPDPKQAFKSEMMSILRRR